MKSSRAEAASARAGQRRGKPLSTVDTPPSPPRTRSSPARSPARKRRTSPPPIAPATRTRSPGRRSPARRSPARKSSTKFPAPKSPARTAEVRKSPSRKAAKNEEPAQLKPKLSEPVLRLARTRRSEYSIKDLSGLAQVEVSMGDRLNGLDNPRGRVPRATVAPQKIEVVRRTSARLRESVSLHGDSVSRPSESASRSLDLLLDEDSEEEPLSEKSSPSMRKLVTPLRGFSLGRGTAVVDHCEFGGYYASWFLIVALPAFVFTVLTQCITSCTFTLPQLGNASVAALLSTRASVLAVSQVALQTVIASLMIAGRSADRMDGSGRHQFFNGLFASFITLIGIFALNFLQILSIKSILEEYVRLAVLFYIMATLLAAGLFLKSRRLSEDKLNTYGNTGYTTYDFWMGRELFPQLGRVDVKVLLHRICNVNGLILSLLIFAQGLTLPKLDTIDVQNYKDALSHLQYNPTLLVISSMQLVYFLNLIFNEHKITSTFSWQSEGVGYMQTVSSALYPFYFVIISKFVLDKEISLPNGVLGAASAVYLVGFVVYLFSNNVKHEFRNNPLQAKMSYLEAMPTFLGKKLIVSGLWGTVRHPNYLGDIILHAALAVPGAFTGPSLAILPPVTAALILLHRASRDSSRCRRRYGAAWQRYSMKVPSAVIPKVY